MIGALSVSVSFPGLDKRDAADTLHLLRVNSRLLRIFLSFFYPLCLKLMTIWSGSFVWVFPSD